MNTLTLKIKKSEQDRLNRIAMRYGLSLPELAKRVLEEVREEFELESVNDYKNSKEVLKDIDEAPLEYKKGIFETKL
jgi:hypothetical protein